MTDALSSALGGLNTQSQRLASSAGRIANMGNGETDLVKETVNIMEAKSLFKANLSVIKTENEMLGDLLDIIT
jgi:flagellar basal body rod protein FlgC